jgi:hypothetical protein
VIDHTLLQLALRAKLRTLSVCTTGSVSLSSTTTGYARASGSFICVGMEVTPSGFTQTAVGTITGVTALTLTILGGRSAEAAASRTLTVGLPSRCAWENVALAPSTGTPYVEEQYIPGPMAQVTLGALGELEVLPMYSPRIYVPSNADMLAAGNYADAILTLFAPGTPITVSGATVTVRRDVGPFRGQLQQAEPGYAVVPVSIPLRLRTSNTI